jgi:hypothetical protein
MIDLLTTFRSQRPRSGHTLLHWALPGLLLLLGCLGKASSNGVEGSQTHFLSCDVDADCRAVDQRLSCQGGQCRDPSVSSGPARENGVGDPCIISDEASPDYSGANVGELNIDAAGQNCGAGLFCLASHFQGRVTCPTGQAAGSGECFTSTGEPIMVAVAPQLESRPAEERVVCTCRCAGPGPGDFCSCPSGMRCETTFLPTGQSNEYEGSYCAYPDDGTR